MAAGVSIVLQAEPLLPAEWAVRMPAARTFSTTARSTLGSLHPSETGQLQELSMTSGARSGRGFSTVQVGGSDKPLVALDIGRRCTVSLVHIAAADPARPGRHADLVAGAVIAHHGAHGVRAVAVVVARKRASLGDRWYCCRCEWHRANCSCGRRWNRSSRGTG